MNLPAFIAQDAPTLALVVRAKITGDLPNTSYDAAWDALEKPEDYQPTPEVDVWMRENWHSTTFGAIPQADSLENTPVYPVSRMLARAWMPAFLDKFVTTGGNATAAAAYAGVHERTPYKAREHDTVFAEEWTWAERKVADAINQEMYRRGILGWSEPQFGRQVGKDAGDGVIGAVQRFDSAVLIKMATARVPEFRSLVKEGAPNLSASASASASSHAEATAVPPEKIRNIQARNRKQLEKQMERASNRLQNTGKN